MANPTNPALSALLSSLPECKEMHIEVCGVDTAFDVYRADDGDLRVTFYLPGVEEIIALECRFTGNSTVRDAASVLVSGTELSLADGYQGL